MNEFWNKRYSSEEFAYGEKPNEFFKQELDKLSAGRILLPAEGEGRNAVYAALKGWNVVAFDSSSEGKRKAEILAQNNGVALEYQVCDFYTFEPKEKFDCIALTFVHVPPSHRNEIHQLFQNWLKPNGCIIMQGFAKEQLGKASGGPQNLDMLFSIEEIKEDFINLSIEQLSQTETILDEGEFHRGNASLINFVGFKKQAKSV